ncbi:MAG: hypothetical protein HRU17_11985 [Polyangiaceae bacterium]|nr:hypothetical protein [Polyangiaceae bacterium]
MDPKLGVRQLSLGVVHGGVGPPKIAVNADGRVVIAMLDGDANGTLVRLATTDTGPSPAIVWGPLVPVGGDESDEIALVATSGRTLLVWDDWNRAENHGVVLGQVFSLPKLTARAERMSLSPNGVDAERPLLAGRDGGYWIVWLHHGVSKPSALGNALSQLAAPRANHNWLEITMLGEDGAPISSPRVLTPKRATISAFDLSVSTDGRALVASQQPSNGHGVTRGGRIELSLVAVGGNVDSTVLADDEVGVGLPSLTVSASNRQLQWLSFLDAEDRLRLGVVRFSSPPGSDVELVPGLAGQTVVAARQDELLFASQQGTRMALRLARCEHDVSEERGPRPVQARSVVPLPRPATSPLASAAIPADPASAAPPQPAPKPRATGLNSRGPKAAAPKTGEPSATGVKPALAEPPMPDFD